MGNAPGFHDIFIYGAWGDDFRDVFWEFNRLEQAQGFLTHLVGMLIGRDKADYRIPRLHSTYSPSVRELHFVGLSRDRNLSGTLRDALGDLKQATRPKWARILLCRLEPVP